MHIHVYWLSFWTYIRCILALHTACKLAVCVCVCVCVCVFVCVCLDVYLMYISYVYDMYTDSMYISRVV